MERSLLLACAVVSIASAGCSAIVAPDTSRFGPGIDGGAQVSLDAALGDDAQPTAMDDASTVDVDSGPLPDVDASRPSDGGPLPIDGGPLRIDGGPRCAEGATRCEGEVRVVCRSGVEVREDCGSARSYCEAGACRPWACEPGSRMCSVDRRSVVQCDARGTGTTTTACSLYCEASTTSCSGAITCDLLPTIAVGGNARIDLCSEDDDETYVPGPNCGSTMRADVGDRTYQLRITTRTTVAIDVRDIDSGVGIDTVVYLRSACDDESSQLACDDDVPCTESDITSGCSGGFQVRQSRIVTTLDPGTYYVVVDAFDYDTFGCGDVELRVMTR